MTVKLALTEADLRAIADSLKSGLRWSGATTHGTVAGTR